MDSSGATVGHGLIVIALTSLPIAYKSSDYLIEIRSIRRGNAAWPGLQLLFRCKQRGHTDLKSVSTLDGPTRGAALSAKKQPKGKTMARVAKKAESLSQRLIKALASPLRVQILALMNDREWSPNELSEELVEGLSQISYHVKVLKDFELIEMTRTEPRRGAVEHYYRAIERAYIPSAMAKLIPKSGQRIIADDILEAIDKDVAASIKSGRFYEREDSHVTWTPADLDEEGCQEANELADEFVERFLKIEASSANRRAESKDGGEHIAISAAVLVFGSEHGEKKKAPSRKRATSKGAK